MKNYYVFAFLAIILLSACEKEEVLREPENSIEYIQSKEDFQYLANSGIYPLNKLSPSAIDHFKENLLFIDNNMPKGGDYSYVRAELNDKELDAFWIVIFGDNTIILEGNETKKPELGNNEPWNPIKVKVRFEPFECLPSMNEEFCIEV